ncbi:MAG: glycosyltransferase [Holdemanella sp.]|nr:glycosyltransferase [Holdemanella sp.]
MSKVKNIIDQIKKDPRKITYYMNRFKKVMTDKDERIRSPYNQETYLKWLQTMDERSEEIKLFYKPSFSFVIPVYNVSRRYLMECIESILNQTYQNFEICLVDDCSTNSETIETLKEYRRNEKIKVKFRTENGHISKATNDALALAKNEFICMMDNDDVLAPNALYECALALNKDKNIDFIYTDEDKYDPQGKRYMPHFKPDYSPDLLLGTNYMCHFTVIRRSIVESVYGFTPGLEGAQDHDLFLKVCEKTDKVYHIPKILYHWRMIEGSTALDMSNKSYVIEHGIQTVQNALERRNQKATIKQVGDTTDYLVDYEMDENVKVDIFVKGDRSKFLNKLKNENYAFIDELQEGTGDVICIVDDSIEFIDSKAILSMIGYALLDHAGVVSCKQVYKGKIVQAGILLGMKDNLFLDAYKGLHEEEEVIFGALSIPCNYSCVSNCIVFKRELLNKDINYNLKDYIEMDICLDALSKGKYNVCLPHVKVKKYPKQIDNVRERNYLYQKYHRYFENDPYYNPNFSKTYPFKLEL